MTVDHSAYGRRIFYSRGSCIVSGMAEEGLFDKQGKLISVATQKPWTKEEKLQMEEEANRRTVADYFGWVVAFLALMI